MGTFGIGERRVGSKVAFKIIGWELAAQATGNFSEARNN